MTCSGLRRYDAILLLSGWKVTMKRESTPKKKSIDAKIIFSRVETDFHAIAFAEATIAKEPAANQTGATTQNGNNPILGLAAMKTTNKTIAIAFTIHLLS